MTAARSDLLDKLDGAIDQQHRTALRGDSEWFYRNAKTRLRQLREALYTDPAPDPDHWLDRLIDVWHEGSNVAEKPLYEFLGVTEERYAAWVEQRADLPHPAPGALHRLVKALVDAYAEGEDLDDLMCDLAGLFTTAAVA